MRLIKFNSNIVISLNDPRWSIFAINMVRCVLKACKLQNLGISLNLSNDKEIQNLNYKWKGKKQPTNVLSFPNYSFPKDPNNKKNYLGDIILSYQTLKKESVVGNLSFTDHMSHLLVHGILHLRGYKHDNRVNEKVMQDEEIRILKKLSVCNPYKNNRTP